MEISEYFPIWNRLTEAERTMLTEHSFIKQIPAGTVIRDGHSDCMGLLLLRSGQLRAYIASEEGREITLYRLLERDICLFSASCMFRSLQFDLSVAAEKDSEVWVIPLDVYQSLTESSVAVANYTNELMGSRFSEVMWLIEQIMWKSLDKRLAAFLLEESGLENSTVLKCTHEQIASHLGTAREVVTRLLRYFRSEGLVRLSRGSIEIVDEKGIMRLAE